MRAGEREFRLRFWIFYGLFGAAYFSYAIDHVNAGQWLLRAVAGRAISGEAGERLALGVLFGAGSVLCLAGAAVRTWATAYLRSAVVHDGRVHSESLVADGPYRHVRNPLYLGTQLLMFGLAPTTSRLGAVLLVVGGVLFHLRLIGREEAALESAQGEAFRAYRARVPMLVPSLVPRVPRAGRTPRWGDGLLGEAFLWIIALASVAFAVTLNLRTLMYASAAGMAVYWIVMLARRQGRSRGARA